MTPEQRAREFVEVGFRSFGVPLEPYVQIIAELIAGAETDLRVEIERLKVDEDRAGQLGEPMTRQDAIQKIVDHFAAQGEDAEYVERALRGDTPIWGCLMLLEALGLVKYDDPPPT